MSRVLPILFNTEMVRAILGGRKTVTRRLCKDANDWTTPDMGFYDGKKRTYAVHNYTDRRHKERLSIAECRCPICPEDILYVRETWGISNVDYDDKVAYIVYRASKSEKDEGCRAVRFPNDKFEKLYDSIAENMSDWRPSIHMPKEAARIFLRVTDVRVERLQDITSEQIEREGVETESPFVLNGEEKRYAFSQLWDGTIKKKDIDRYGWDSNPWVWVIEFERCEKPEEEE